MVTLPAGRHFRVVQAVDATDVVAAITYAKANGRQVGVRSGGHSWAGNHVRDGGLLLDVSRLDDCHVDRDTMVAVVGPGKGGSVLAGELAAAGLFFPAGHCKGVRIGGYLLQGGYGWNSRALGPACESVIGLDVVTAFHLRIYPNPPVCGSSLYVYPLDYADENLGQRPAKFATDDTMTRLDEVRAAYDPDGRFYRWMGLI